MLIQPIIDKFIGLELLNRKYLKRLNIFKYTLHYGSLLFSLIMVLTFLNVEVWIAVLLVLGGWFTVSFIIGIVGTPIFGILFFVIIFSLFVVLEYFTLYLNKTIEKYADIVENIYSLVDYDQNETLIQETKEKTNIPKVIKKRSIN